MRELCEAPSDTSKLPDFSYHASDPFLPSGSVPSSACIAKLDASTQLWEIGSLPQTPLIMFSDNIAALNIQLG